jgi:phage gp46-like protein
MIQLIFNPRTQACDVARNGKNLIDDPTLSTAILISLFTRRLANADDALPYPGATREGWWADTYNTDPDDLWGSRLWLLSRSKADDDTLTKAKAYVEEALAWLVVDGVASEVVAETSWQKQQGADLMMAIRITITKPADVAAQWSALWVANLALL